MWRAIEKKERNKKTKQRTYNILWITTLKVLRLLVEQYNWKLNVLNKANEMRIKKNIIFYDRPSSQAKPRWNIKKKKSYKKYLCICSHFICIKMVLLMLFFAFFNYRFNGDASAVKTGNVRPFTYNSYIRSCLTSSQPQFVLILSRPHSQPCSVRRTEQTCIKYSLGWCAISPARTDWAIRFYNLQWRWWSISYLLFSLFSNASSINLIGRINTCVAHTYSVLVYVAHCYTTIVVQFNDYIPESTEPDHLHIEKAYRARDDDNSLL